MGRKKDNQFVVARATAALNAAFVHGMAHQRFVDAQNEAAGTHEALQQRIGELNEVIIIPAKKDMH